MKGSGLSPQDPLD